MRKKEYAILSLCMLGLFALWTAAITAVDVQAIGPQGSSVGFAGLNGWFHSLTGVHMWLYTLTDWLSLIPLLLVPGFAILGLTQWIGRKSLLKVDRSILTLGGFYATVLGIYLFFEKCIVNYRPVLIEGRLEASYPSSTTVLVICVMITAAMEFQNRIQNPRKRRWITRMITIFTVLMVIGRLLSGVHWFTDIVGGILLSAGLVMLYSALAAK